MSKYISLIDGHECQDFHYLVELVIMREAKKSGITLPNKFWNTDQWKKKYKLQVIAARSLLKIFEMQDILAGLRCKEGSWIYSLQNRTLIDIIQSEKQKKEKQSIVKPNQVVEVNIDNSEKTVVKPKVQKTKNIMDTLEGIDANIQRDNF